MQVLWALVKKSGLSENRTIRLTGENTIAFHKLFADYQMIQQCDTSEKHRANANWTYSTRRRG
jgi:hypothetical protein